MPIEGAHNCWDEVEASTYRVRCLDYTRTKLKGPSEKSIYRLVAIDMFTTQQKAFHVAKLVHLPPTPPPVLQPDGGVLPPLLVVNVQLPEYPATLFGSNDGPGLSIVYYFVLPDDFDPVKFGNQKALGLLQRFVANGREADGQPTRERLKMIPRCVSAGNGVCQAWWGSDASMNVILQGKSLRDVLAPALQAHIKAPWLCSHEWGAAVSLM